MNTPELKQINITYQMDNRLYDEFVKWVENNSIKALEFLEKWELASKGNIGYISLSEEREEAKNG